MKIICPKDSNGEILYLDIVISSPESLFLGNDFQRCNRSGRDKKTVDSLGKRVTN
jgi:hypothetical protein